MTQLREPIFNLSQYDALECTRSNILAFTEGKVYPVHKNEDSFYILNNIGTKWFQEEFPLTHAEFKPVEFVQISDNFLGTIFVKGVDEHVNEPDEPTLKVSELLDYINEGEITHVSPLKLYLEGYQKGFSNAKEGK